MSNDKRQAVLLLSCEVVWHAGAVADGCAELLTRMRLARVPVAVVGCLPEQRSVIENAIFDGNGLAGHCYAADAQAPASWHPPRPGQLLQACRDAGGDVFDSWVISTREAWMQAARQAGCVGGVWLGTADDCPSISGLRINQANDLRDAPRVMIPPEGGCWH